MGTDIGHSDTTTPKQHRRGGRLSSWFRPVLPVASASRQPPHPSGPLAALGLTLLCSLLVVGVVFLLSVVLRAAAAPPEFVAYQLENVTGAPSTFTVTPALVRASSNLCFQVPPSVLRGAQMAAGLHIRLGVIIAARWHALLGAVLVLWVVLVSALLIAQLQLGVPRGLALLWPATLHALPLLLGCCVVICAAVTFVLAAPVPSWEVVVFDYFAVDPLPFFALMLGMTAVPAWPAMYFGARHAARHDRASRGECELCGYPRGADPTNPCSECGLCWTEGKQLCDAGHGWFARTIMIAGGLVCVLSLLWPTTLLRPVTPTLLDSPSIVVEAGDHVEIDLQHGTILFEIRYIDTTRLSGRLHWRNAGVPAGTDHPIQIDEGSATGGTLVQPDVFLINLIGGRQLVVTARGGSPRKASLELPDARSLRRLPAIRGVD